VPAHSLTAAARHIATTVLEPAAGEVDASVVPKSHLKSLPDAGLLGVVHGGEQCCPPITDEGVA
jgi:hypothetical protein